MATLAINNSVLIVKYLYDNNGSWSYQRRVPPDLQARFNKQKITLKLNPANGSPAIQVQRIAAGHTKLFEALRNNPELAISEQKLAALSLLQLFGLNQNDGHIRAINPHGIQVIDDTPHLHEFEEYLIDLDREGKLTQVELMAKKALTEPLPVTLSEMPTIYFEHHSKGKNLTYRTKTLEYWNKLISFTGDVAAESVTRAIARDFKSHRESLGLKTASVKKDITIIKAIFNKCILEIPLKMTNPFEKLTVSGLDKDATKRVPFTNDELKTIYKECLANDDDIRRIIICVLATGARLGEIVGLRKQDIHLDEPIPYIQIAEYGEKTVKTANSARLIPLLPAAINAIKRQTKEESSEMLFSRYNDGIQKPNADGASGAINKWLKTTLKINKTSHSFRHSAEDLLRHANVTEDIREELTGRGKQTMSDRYGWGHTLNTKKSAINNAFKVIFK